MARNVVEVHFKSGTVSRFVVASRKEFDAMVKEVTRWRYRWVWLGKNAIIRKKDVQEMIFVEERALEADCGA